MNDRSHGYDVSMEYSFGFYREMAPDWLDFCVRASGYETTRRGGSFRYLELGCGQGFGLCLLAGANSEAEFVGVDLQPEHIAHARDLARSAGLENVRFVEADFADIARAWPDDFGTFDYVALHGILSWVSPEVREALGDCIGHGTRPGSLVYAGYNSQPGWLGMQPFQHVASLLKHSTGKDGPAVIAESISLFERLRDGKAAGFELLPALDYRLKSLRSHDVNYLVHEYLNDNWQPLWHSEAAAQLRRCGLGFAASATISDNLLPQVLPQPLRPPILEQQDGDLRQDLQDFAIAQGFRRDIFCRGELRRASTNIRTDEQTRLVLVTELHASEEVTIATSFGPVQLPYREVGPVIEPLADGPKSMAELASIPLPRDLGQVLLLLAQANMIGIAASPSGSVEVAQRLNATIARATCDGAPYAHLAATSIGSAIPVKEIELLLLDSWLEVSRVEEPAPIAEGLSLRMKKLGRKLYQHGQLIDDAQAADEFRTIASIFIEDVLPRWRQLGVIA